MRLECLCQVQHNLHLWLAAGQEPDMGTHMAGVYKQLLLST